MELALSLEKLNFQKLRELHAVAAKHEDPSMTDFIGKWVEITRTVGGDLQVGAALADVSQSVIYLVGYLSIYLSMIYMPRLLSCQWRHACASAHPWAP